jgi:hypothetical protein
MQTFRHWLEAQRMQLEYERLDRAMFPEDGIVCSILRGRIQDELKMGRD